ncbi:hypothetical protein Csa_001693 [Cucumis sativus]|uniref:Uncharacterized protein n=1 Tax=Cucumis sativus TaxID=3659 RepID=A0A0A0LGX4_CUCSA|nr:hypothetical protein Csa_001693 [Cucumis sativus]
MEIPSSSVVPSPIEIVDFEAFQLPLAKLLLPPASEACAAGRAFPVNYNIVRKDQNLRL